MFYVTPPSRQLMPVLIPLLHQFRACLLICHHRYLGSYSQVSQLRAKTPECTLRSRNFACRDDSQLC